MKKFKGILTATIFSFALVTSSYAETPVKIGIIMPTDIEAMHQIISGFEKTLQQRYPHPIEFKVANAQGDANLQHAIIMQMRDDHYNMIVPIGMGTSQMAISSVKQIPIVALAADISETDRAKFHPCNIAIVDDEINNKQILEFIHTVYPQMKQIALIHSASEKIFPEVKQVQDDAASLGIHVKNIMVTNLPDLQSATHALASDTQGIFVLKDVLIVSGIAQLAQVAAKSKIPLMTSDDGSVKNGAGFAVGVHESDIGTEGALLATQILQGKSACSLPITKMTKLTVFINQQALSRSGLSITPIIQAAHQLGYQIEMLA